MSAPFKPSQELLQVKDSYRTYAGAWLFWRKQQQIVEKLLAYNQQSFDDLQVKLADADRNLKDCKELMYLAVSRGLELRGKS